jgi:heme/copper-type cytochrome/quinol oxidase subunit 2
MNRTIKSALLAMLLGVVLFVVAMFWGVYFAFPHPDASSEEAAKIQLHSTLSGWLMVLAAGTFLVSCITLVVRLIARKRRSRA